MADQNTKLAIQIVTEFVGKAAFTQASKAVVGLEKNVKNLGKTIVGVFAAQKLLNYSKQAVIAYKDDALAAKALTQTLDNLGLAFEDNRAKLFIANLEATFKVADDKLRPALQSLLQVTGSLTKSQSLLQTALNVSAATGVDLQTVTDDLSQAYVGNLRGLRKYNLGLAQAELTTKSFAQIQEVLNNKFKGQALLKAADPLNALALASNNAKETIGKGLVDALNSAVGAGTGINDITKNVNTLANAVSDLIRGIGAGVGFVSYGVKGLIDSAKSIANFLGGGSTSSTSMPKGSYTKGGGKALDLAAAARAKAEQDAIKRNKELLALTQKQAIAAAAAAKAKKEAAILEKAQQLFNIDLIQNVAALQGKITADEKLRLETQQAILTGNAESAGQLAMKLLEAQKNAMLLRQTDPFLGWTDSAAAALAAIQKMIDALKLLGIEQSKTYMPAISVAAGTYYKSSQGISSLTPAIGTSYEYFAGLSGGKYGSTPTYTPQVDINLNVVNGSITADLQNQSVSGTTTAASRLNSISWGM